MCLMVISTHGIQPIASFVYKRGYKMTDQERDDVPMLLRNVELPRFPLRSTSMCIPVKDDEYEEETFVPHTGPLFIQPPTQTTLAIPFTSRNIPDRLPRPSQGKRVSKPHAIMPQETRGNRWSYSHMLYASCHMLYSWQIIGMQP